MENRANRLSCPEKPNGFQSPSLPAAHLKNRSSYVQIAPGPARLRRPRIAAGPLPTSGAVTACLTGWHVGARFYDCWPEGAKSRSRNHLSLGSVEGGEK